MSERVTYPRLYADAAGESHFGDTSADLQPVAFAPPAPALWVSAGLPAESYRFLRLPPGWVGDFHPSPQRQFAVYLAGEVEIEASDGEVRRFGPGAFGLGEDTAGRGHRTRVVGDQPALLAVVRLP